MLHYLSDSPPSASKIPLPPPPRYQTFPFWPFKAALPHQWCFIKAQKLARSLLAGRDVDLRLSRQYFLSEPACPLRDHVLTYLAKKPRHALIHRGECFWEPEKPGGGVALVGFDSSSTRR